MKFQKITAHSRLPIHLKGQSLFELVFALGMVGLILVALMSLSIKAVSNSTFSRNKTLSIRYNQQALEWLRGERDRDWTIFKSQANGSTKCLDDLSWKTNPCTTEKINGTIFTRETTLSSLATDRVEATVETSWSDPSGTHISRSSTIFTNWY